MAAQRLAAMAMALMERADFWAAVERAGIAFPGEVDDLEDALVAFHEQGGSSRPEPEPEDPNGAR
jgi:hypothetical protein